MQTDDKDIANSCKIWKKVLEENIQNITSYCPHAIAKESKESKRIGLSHELKDSTSLVLKNPIQNEFINLDLDIKISSEAPKVKAFGQTIHLFVETLCNLLETANSYYIFKVHPCGSFPLNTKICCINEFDFRLEWLGKVLNSPPILISNVLPYNYLDDKTSEICKTLEKILQKSFSVFEKFKVSSMEFIRKNRAMTIIMLWLCPCDHQHETGVDLAICIKTNVTIEDFLAKGNPFENTKLDDSLTKNKLVYINLPIAGEVFRVETNSFDEDLFTACDMISPNIKLCLRILKYLRDMIFPYRYKQKSKDKFYLESTISSYHLKELLLREVVKHQSINSWSNCDIHKRIKSILLELQKAIIEEGFFSFFESFVVILEGKLSEKILTDLICWMENDCPKVNASVKCIEETETEIYIYGRVLFKIKDRNGQHPYLVGSDIVRSLIKPKFLNDSSVCRWICKEYHDILNSMAQIDLTSLSDLEANQIMGMIIHELINEEDVDSGKYVQKAKMLNNVLETFGATLEDVFFTNDKRYGLFKNLDTTYLQKVYNQTASIEAAHIYRYLKHGTGFDGMESSTSLSEVMNIFENVFLHFVASKDQHWIAAAVKSVTDIK